MNNTVISPFYFDIGECDDSLIRYRTAITQLYGADVLDTVDVPPLTQGTINPGNLHIASVMFWLKEISEAGLPDFVDMLAEKIVRGQLILPVTTSSNHLMRYWRRRHNRFSAQERKSLYSQLFGGPGSTNPNNEFYPAFIRLISILSEIGRLPEDHPNTHLLSRLAIYSRELAANLSNRSVGIIPYAASTILRNVRSARDILCEHDLLTALGSRNIWHCIQMLSPQILGRQINPHPHVTKAGTGFRIIRWLADHILAIESGSVLVDRNHEIIKAAERWIALEGV